jgi:hypothetical protein
LLEHRGQCAHTVHSERLGGRAFAPRGRRTTAPAARAKRTSPASECAEAHRKHCASIAHSTRMQAHRRRMEGGEAAHIARAPTLTRRLLFAFLSVALSFAPPSRARPVHRRPTDCFAGHASESSAPRASCTRHLPLSQLRADLHVPTTPLFASQHWSL